MEENKNHSATHQTPNLLPSDVATAIVNGGPNLVRCIIKLASLGMGQEAIMSAAATRAAGSIPTFSLPSGAPKALTINAWSFLSDRNQHFGVYGMSPSEAAELKELFRRDPEEVVRQITALVTAHLRRTGSTRPVRVAYDGVPSSLGTAGAPVAPATGDGGLKQLRQAIKGDPGLYGQYQFEAVATGRKDAEAFRVDLGGGLSAVGQSKALAIAAARLIRVKGRDDEELRRYARLVMAGRFLGPNDLPAGLFDGKLGPFDVPPPEPPVRAGSNAPTRSPNASP